jgi:hypothetical protein
MDGNLADWQSGDVMYQASEIAVGAPAGSSFTNVMVANDANFVYVALVLPAPASINSPWTTSVFIDADMTASTGFNGGWMSAGYDHLVQYGAAGSSYSVFSFIGAAQGDWSWNWLGLIEYSHSDQVIEWAIPVGSLGLTTNKMKMEFSVSGEGITTETWAYQWESGVGTYTLALPPPVTPPELAAIEAAPNKVQVTFSKPVTPATAGVVANYSLSGGLSVLAATPNAGNPRVVTLTTSPQARGSVYKLTVNNVTDEGGSPIAANSQKAFVSSILIDGSFEDWDGVPSLYTNEPGDPTATSFKEVFAFNDADYIYFRLTLWEASDLLSAQNNIFVDADNDFATGNTFWGGSELLIQGGTGYQQKNGGFNEGLIDGLEFLAFNAGRTNYEFRISRAAKYVSDGLRVFTTNVINFAFDGESNWVTVNRMPVGSGLTIAYNLVEPSAPLGPLAVSVASGQISVTWSGPGRLQASESLAIGSWVDVPAAASPYSTPATVGHRFFRLVQ